MRRRARGPAVVVTLSLLLGASVTACADGGEAASETGGTGQPNATIVRVVDGDTVVANVDGTDERVRMIGIDTPESVKENTPVECFGKEASARTAELLPRDTPVRLVLDAEPRDRYGRLLAYVYRTSDNMFVNKALVAEGFANAYVYPPNVAHTDELKAAERAARSSGTGLWSACRNNPPFNN